MEESREMLPSRHSGTNAHVNSQGLVVAQGLYRFKLDGIPYREEEVGTGSHPSPRSYLKLIATAKGKIRFCQWSLIRISATL